MKISLLKEKWPLALCFQVTSMLALWDQTSVHVFQYEVFLNHGFTFVIAYIILLVCFTLPVVLCETLLGTLLRKGPVEVFGRVPILQGIAYGMLAYNALYSIVSGTTTALYGYYFYHTFGQGFSIINSCENPWNHVNCQGWVAIGNLSNQSINDDDNGVARWHRGLVTPAQDYFDTHVRYPNHDTGETAFGLQGYYVGYVGIVWALVTLILLLGPTSLGFTAIIALLFIKISLLCFAWLAGKQDGGHDGRHTGFRPSWDKLCDPDLWIKAAYLAGTNRAIGFGLYMNLASFNHTGSWKSLFCRIPWAIISELILALAASAIAFSFYGFASHSIGVSIDDLVARRHDYSFLTLTSVFGLMGNGQAWAGLYYALMFVLGLVSCCLFVETINTGILNTLEKFVTIYSPELIRPFVAVITGSVLFLLSLIFCTDKGYFAIMYFDQHISTLVPLFVGIEVLAFGFYVGYKVLASDRKNWLKMLQVTGLGLFITFLLLETAMLQVVLIKKKLDDTYRGDPTAAWVLATVPLMITFIATVFCLIFVATRARARKESIGRGLLMTDKGRSRYAYNGYEKVPIENSY